MLYKEGRYEQALQQFSEASKLLGYQPGLLYNTALCQYRQKQFGPALKALGEVIERGVREHPELSVGSATEGLDVRSVGNSQVGAGLHAARCMLQAACSACTLALRTCATASRHDRGFLPAPRPSLTAPAAPRAQVLHETSLVEAFNLKAAIEYDLRNHDAAREALTDMPPRAEEELDAVGAFGCWG